MIIPQLLEQPMLIGLGLMIVLIGLGSRGVGQFWPTYLEQLGARDSLIAAISTFSAIVELPFMFLADYLMKRYGTYRLLLLAMMIYTCLRLMVFFVPAVPTIMFEQAMNGICYSFYTIGIVRFIGEQTDHEGETRMLLAFFTVTLVSVTSIVSGPLAGTLFDHFGPHKLYVVAAAGYFLAGLALFAAKRFQGKMKRVEA
jgi:PPP family 3-phenylpropionic acid transporter